MKLQICPIEMSFFFLYHLLLYMSSSLKILPEFPFSLIEYFLGSLVNIYPNTVRFFGSWTETRKNYKFRKKNNRKYEDICVLNNLPLQRV